MSEISPAAETAREQARTQTGQFGTQSRTAPAWPSGSGIPTDVEVLEEQLDNFALGAGPRGRYLVVRRAPGATWALESALDRDGAQVVWPNIFKRGASPSLDGLRDAVPLISPHNLPEHYITVDMSPEDMIAIDMDAVADGLQQRRQDEAETLSSEHEIGGHDRQIVDGCPRCHAYEEYL